jgi:hypothetical protein
VSRIGTIHGKQLSGSSPWIQSGGYRETFAEIDGLMEGTATKARRDWNCQSWVRDALEMLVKKGLITETEKETAIELQKEAIHLPFTDKMPNKRALKG